MASNTNTAKGRVRVTYVEEASVVKALEKLAKETGLTVSNLLRQAAWDYVKSHQNSSEPAVKRDPKRGS
jgi:ABC-type Zn uptake system ZnuABC Zn-binding protein ZnuA